MKRPRSSRSNGGSRKRPKTTQEFDISARNGDLVFRTPPASTIRRATAPIVLAKTGFDTGGAVTFEANQMLNWAEISALYDQYCIDKVQFVFELATPFISNGVYPYIVVAPDYTDVVAPASLNAAMELAQAKVFQFSPEKTRLSITLKPRPAMQAFQSAVAAGYAIPSGDVWFSSDNSTVDHYGLKYWLADYNNTISNITAIRGFAVFHLKVRSTR